MVNRTRIHTDATDWHGFMIGGNPSYPCRSVSYFNHIP